MIQGFRFSVTLMLQKGVLETPRGSFKFPPGLSVYEDLTSVHIVLQPGFGYVETDHDTH